MAYRGDIMLKNRCFVFFLLLLLFVPGSQFLAHGVTNAGAFPVEVMNGDVEPPTLVINNTPIRADTGGSLTFSANFTDNVSVVAANVNYTYGRDVYFNLSMDHVSGEKWEKTITVNISAVAIEYFFHFKDGADNFNVSSPGWVVVNDTIRPVADAGNDMEVLQDEQLNLDGTGSYDNVEIVNYTWVWFCPPCAVYKYRYGPLVNLYPNPTDFNITLNVTDAAGNWDTDVINITVLDSEEPWAQANDDIIIDQHETAYFDGSLSTDNTMVINWTWTFDYNGSRIFIYGEYANFTFHIPGKYTVILEVKDTRGNSGPASFDSLMVTVRDITGPRAAAGPDVIVDQHTKVRFNGTGSSDNVGISMYRWMFNYLGKSKTLTGPEPEFTFDPEGVYEVTLNVSDSGGGWDVDTMTVTVLDITSPRADAGEDMDVGFGKRAVFNGSGSTDNVGIVNYTWEFVYNDTIISLYGLEVNFSFKILRSFNVMLKVRDAAGKEGADTVTVNVLDDMPPVVNAGQDRTVDEGTEIYLDGGTTVDHSYLEHFNWSFVYGGEEKKLYGERVSFRFERVGVYTVYLFVKDMWGNEGWGTVIIRVRDATPPVAIAEKDAAILAGKTMVFIGNGTDDLTLTGQLNYTWTFTYNGTEERLYGRTTTFVFDDAGEYAVDLTVRDEGGNEDTDRMWVNVTALDNGDDDTDPDDDDDDGNGTNSNSSMDVVNIAIIAGIVLVIILIVAMLFHKPASGGDEGGARDDDVGRVKARPERAAEPAVEKKVKEAPAAPVVEEVRAKPEEAEGEETAGVDEAVAGGKDAGGEEEVEEVTDVGNAAEVEEVIDVEGDDEGDGGEDTGGALEGDVEVDAESADGEKNADPIDQN